jgi:hypothetical protein
MSGAFKSREENYRDAKSEALFMETEEIKQTLKDRSAYHKWYVLALEEELVRRDSRVAATKDSARASEHGTSLA